MKVCFLTGTYHPKIGGAETYARTIAEGICKAGHEVVVVTDGVGDNMLPQEELCGVRILRASRYDQLLNDPTKVRWEQMYFSLLTDLEQLLHNERIDILHVNGLDTALLGSMIALTLGIPLVCTFHEQEPEKEPFGPGKSRLIFSKVPINRFIAGSRFYYNKAIEHGSDRERTRLIYHGVDQTIFHPMNGKESRSKYGIADNELLIVCAARLKERKGLLELIRALRMVKDKMPQVRALIAGSCNSASRDYADMLYEEIEHLGLTGVVRIEEELTLSDMPSFYASADLVVQPSHAEGLGLAVLEGLASGKAVVATAVHGIQEIMTDGQDGLLVPPRAVKPLADAIIRLLTDNTLRQSLAETGKQLVSTKFNIQRMVQETEQVYKELLSNVQKVVDK